MDLAERSRVHAALADPSRLAVVDALSGGDLTPGELADAVGAATNLMAHHLRVLEEAGVVERRVSEGDRRRRYVTLRTDRLHRLVPSASAPVAGTVLFVCTGNSARSQFAAALWRERAGGPAESAGRRPADRVHPGARRLASRRGLRLDGRPRGYDEVRTAPALVVSVCDRAREDAIPFDAPLIHWSVPDPVAGGDPQAFEDAFAEIARRIDRLAASPN